MEEGVVGAGWSEKKLRRISSKNPWGKKLIFDVHILLDTAVGSRLGINSSSKRSSEAFPPPL